ncbi:MAG: hypothetical protein ACFFB0_10355 [Promethearchaeota archaeon]
MTDLNKILIMIISVMLLPITGFLTGNVNNELDKENHHIDELQSVIKVCEDLNWEAYSLHYNLKSMDWYIGAMVNDGLMSVEEGNNTIYKFIIENAMTPLEIEDRSGINDYSDFKNNPDIITERYITDLYDENYFSFNFTYDILINEYGENTKPFTIFFETDVMDSIVRSIQLDRISSLKEIQFYFSILISFFGFTITLLSIKRKAEKKQNKTKPLEHAEKSLLDKILTDFLPFISFGICIVFFGYPLYLYLSYFFF